MFFETDDDPDWYEFMRPSDAELDGFVPPIPDELDLVVECNDQITALEAERLDRIDQKRLAAMRDDSEYGQASAEIALRSVRLELAAAMRISEYAVDKLIWLAEALIHRYPSAMASLRRTRITKQHATVIVEVLDGIEPELRDEVLGKALELAESQPVGTFRRQLAKLVETLRSDTLSERHEAAVQARRIHLQPESDSMGCLSIFGPMVELQAIHGRVTAMAKAIKADPDETRTLDQIRADVASDLLIDGDTTHTPAKARGIRATVAVTVPMLSLIDPEGSRGAEPAVVEGVGPIPIERARELCGTATGFMRILTDPERGMVLSVSRKRYETPEPLRRLVQWRADRCMAPGCGMPASRCEIDHSIAWQHGGHTSLTNLCPLCTGHHTVKHHGGWTVHLLPDGSLEWTSPTGRRYVVAPERRVPVFTPVAASDDEGVPPF